MHELRATRTLTGLAVLGIMVAIVGTVIALRVGGSNAGGLPTAVAVNPGLVGQTPAPTYTPHPARGQTTLSADKAIASVTSRRLSAAESILPGTAHAEIRDAGEIPDIQGIAVHYASDYPVWIVTSQGTFYPFSEPPGVNLVFHTSIDYLDGYTGAEILHQLADPVTATPMPPSGTATP